MNLQRTIGSVVRRIFNKKPGRGSGESASGRRHRKLSVECLEARELLSLSAVGPVDPANGFPFYYQDSTGLKLALCLDNIPECGPPPIPDPALPVSFPDNFPDESFYFRGVAKMNTNGTGLATLVLATEAAFANAVVNGDQMTFGRVRFRADHLVPGATYTVTHPYGVDTAVADGLGAINVTQDVGAVPVGLIGPAAFALTLGTRIGPFLQWDPAVAPAAPAGFIGTFALDHKVIGSPFMAPVTPGSATLGPANFFRIQGLNVGGAGVNVVQTNLFGIIGKIFPKGTISGTKFEDVNGNGVKDAGDPGLAGWTIFLDTNGDTVLNNPISGNGVCDANAAEPCTITSADNPATAANEAGTYQFPLLDPGTYTVREVLQPGWVQTAPAAGTHVVNIFGKDVAGRDFGNAHPVTISGRTFDDLNGDGIEQATEPGVGGFTIQVDLGNNGTVDATTVTAPNGTYSFPGVVPGTHKLSEVPEAGTLQTLCTHVVTTTSGVNVTGRDFGNTRVTPIGSTNTAVVRCGSLLVTGSLGKDDIRVRPANGLFQVTVGGVTSNISPAGVSRIIVRGLDGDDRIQIDAAIVLPTWLDGDDGNDQLTGGGGNDILVGDAGVDVLTGRAGRDLLIGGIGADTLSDTAGSNILIAGRTAHDSSVGLLSIMRLWGDINVTGLSRANALSTTGADGFILNSTTVFRDGAVDRLTGGNDFDWFFREAIDQIAAGDLLTNEG